MGVTVFDTGALSLLFAPDERIRPYAERIGSGKDKGIISSVTLSEFYYRVCRTAGRDVADVWSLRLSERMEVVPLDFDLAMAAGREKCRNTRLSLVDAHALALAVSLNGTLLTTDGELARAKAKVKHFGV